MKRNCDRQDESHDEVSFIQGSKFRIFALFQEWWTLSWSLLSFEVVFTACVFGALGYHE